jgi:hypothetical protein
MSDARNIDAVSHGPEVEGCLEACRRCRDVVDSVRRSGPEIAGAVYARVGPHLRHCVDHFRCLFRALDQAGVVDYDARDRDATVEVDPGRFLEELVSVETRLRSLSDADLGGTTEVRQAAAPGGREATSTSNLARELVFLSGHTIHHLAIVRLLCEAGGVPVPEDVTMAYSTEAFRSGSRPRSG